MRSLSPKELAEAIGVSESSLKRWADDGVLAVERTAGGHRRIPMAEAVRFVREAGIVPKRPELLGLPGARVRERGREEVAGALFEALVQDRPAEARSLIVSLYVEGARLGWIFDVPVRAALARVGALWAHDPSGIFLEHRATETCLGALAEIRLLIPAASPGAPVALGGAVEGDPYRLPSAMLALIAAEGGFQDRDLGADTPDAALKAAIEHYRPGLVWRTIGAPPASPRQIAAGLERLALAADPAPMVAGGRGMGEVQLPRAGSLHRLETMTEFAAFVKALATRE